MLGVISGHPACRRCDRFCSVHPKQQTFPQHAGWTGCRHWPLLPRTQARSAPLLPELSSLLFQAATAGEEGFVDVGFCIPACFSISWSVPFVCLEVSSYDFVYYLSVVVSLVVSTSATNYTKGNNLFYVRSEMICFARLLTHYCTDSQWDRWHQCSPCLPQPGFPCFLENPGK